MTAALYRCTVVAQINFDVGEWAICHVYMFLTCLLRSRRAVEKCAIFGSNATRKFIEILENSNKQSGEIQNKTIS